jgi:hypothetical protein
MSCLRAACATADRFGERWSAAAESDARGEVETGRRSRHLSLVRSDAVSDLSVARTEATIERASSQRVELRLPGASA